MENVLVDKKDKVAIMTLNRPKCLNAMNDGLVEDFHAALTQLEQDETVRVIILTGAGRAFCAGGDLNYLEGLTDDLARQNFIRRVGQMTSHLKNCAKPVIAMVNGVTAGAGVNLMLACDIVCSSENAKFIQSFVNVGLIPDCGGMYLLKKTVGLQKAKELMFTADVISAQEAEKLQSAPLAIRYMKKMLNKSYHNLEEFLDEEALVQAFCLSTQDCKEGIQAFKEKRAPQFIGK